jgi:hypothetical protein
MTILVLLHANNVLSAAKKTRGSLSSDITTPCRLTTYIGFIPDFCIGKNYFAIVLLCALLNNPLGTNGAAGENSCSNGI